MKFNPLTRASSCLFFLHRKSSWPGIWLSSSTRNASLGPSAPVSFHQVPVDQKEASAAHVSRDFSLSAVTNEGWNETDLKYLRFGREIQSLGQSLKQLAEVADNARKDRSTGRSGSDERAEEDDIYRAQLQPLSEMTGDFQETLEECNTLLNNHKHFRRNPANFIDNVIWHTNVERDVLILTGRLQFHVTKVLFILKPLEM